MVARRWVFLPTPQCSRTRHSRHAPALQGKKKERRAETRAWVMFMLYGALRVP